MKDFLLFIQFVIEISFIYMTLRYILLPLFHDIFIKKLRDHVKIIKIDDDYLISHIKAMILLDDKFHSLNGAVGILDKKMSFLYSGLILPMDTDDVYVISRFSNVNQILQDSIIRAKTCILAKYVVEPKDPEVFNYSVNIDAYSQDHAELVVAFFLKYRLDEVLAAEHTVEEE